MYTDVGMRCIFVAELTVVDTSSIAKLVVYGFQELCSDGYAEVYVLCIQ